MVSINKDFILDVAKEILSFHSPSGFCFEKISTFISLPMSQDSGNNGHEQQNTNKFFIFILISKIDTSTIRSHIITDAMINGNPFFC